MDLDDLDEGEDNEEALTELSEMVWVAAMLVYEERVASRREARVTAAEYARRRRALQKAIGPKGLAIVPAAREVVRNRDVHYPFRQSSDFTYLTGFPEPDALAVFAPGRKEGEYVLFCPPPRPGARAVGRPAGRGGGCDRRLRGRPGLPPERAGRRPARD